LLSERTARALKGLKLKTLQGKLDTVRKTEQLGTGGSCMRYGQSFLPGQKELLSFLRPNGFWKAKQGQTSC
jgi:hypothetical protein